MKVLIAGGGTAGHVNPAIALAQALEGHDVLFLGTERGVEAVLVPAAGFELETIDVRGFDRGRPWSIFATGIRAIRAVFQARRVVRRFGPQVVVGMGGYVSLPACLAAWMTDAAVVLHEQNIVFGLAHRLSKPMASRVAVSFQETLESAGRKGVVTGNPSAGSLTDLNVQEARARAYQSFGLTSDRRTLLVFGGSLGARTVNEGAAGLAGIWRDRRDLQVLHITGRADHDRVVAAISGAGEGALTYRVEPYVDSMGEAYAVADLALCRGGASTVAELCLLGVPSIVVPYPHHRDRQQERHAEVLERAGAAEVLLDDQASPERIAELAGDLLSDPQRLSAMGSAAAALARPSAAKVLATVVLEAA